MAKTEEGGSGGRIVISCQLSVGNRAYKALPQRESSPTRDLPFQLSVNPPNPLIRGAFVVSFQGVRLGNLASKKYNLKLYLTFVRKYWIIRVASWSEVKPTPS